MRVVFMGSDAFSVPSLRVVLKHHQVPLVVTQPDRPHGRGLKESRNPVKQAAEKLGLPIAQPAKLRDPEFLQQLTELAPDICVVVAFGKIIPKAVLSLPKHGCVNVHGSVLPEYRGAAPIERAIANGETTGGITTFYMNEGLDTGDVIQMRTVEFGAGETGGDLRARLSEVGAEVLEETLAQIAAGTAPRQPQDLEAGKSTYSPTIKNDETWIDWQQPATRIANTIRAFYPTYGTQTLYRGQVLKLKQARAVEQPAGANGAGPGTIAAVVKNVGIVVECGGPSYLLLQEVQPAGKRWMDSWALAQGYRPTAGERMETKVEQGKS
ncbi:MAG: methionyl-tRNA formyltransferase [Candidatus Xenobia bacterium]